MIKLNEIFSPEKFLNKKATLQTFEDKSISIDEKHNIS